MNYMLLVYSSETAWTKDEWVACTEKSGAICQELAERGQFLSASPLHPVATATTVRVRDGNRQITTGPFAETVEQLGGYFLLNLDNLDEAIAIAARLPAAHKGTVEIRPIRDTNNLPDPSEIKMTLVRRWLMGFGYEALATAEVSDLAIVKLEMHCCFIQLVK
jgi:hypothetical protein